MIIREHEVDALEREAREHLPAVAAEPYDPAAPHWFVRLLRRAEETLRRSRTWEARRSE